ncbi:sugar ABC transporter substrate-binding protein [Streptomyces sp. B6B3]|uniref:ABC transporter substrate-binding protein n=1 Tax=Streptomyces sp. B6B3 TaxID=3153570 RepID=UPI00325D0BEE
MTQSNFPRPGAPLGRRGFLGLAAGGAATGAAALSGCALSVAGGATGRNTVTIMATEGDFTDEMIEQAADELGIRINVVLEDVTLLTAMLASGQPPDLVRGLGALQTPYLAARDVAEELDPYFARSSILNVDDLDPVNDLWRYDGRRQGRGPIYGMAKDYSQDSMFWFNTALFDEAGVGHPSTTEPVTYDELLDLGERVTQRRDGRTTVYGLSASGLGLFSNLMVLTASAGGSLFSEDLGRVDFSTPEARRALTWYLDFARAGVGPSLIDPNPDGWDGPTYNAGRMAMAGAGYWFLGNIAATPEIAEASRFAPAPQFDTGRRVSPCQAGTGFWIPKKAPHKELAWRLFEWYFGEGPAEARASGGWGIPTLESLRPLMPTAEPFQRQAFEVQQAELEYFSVLSFTPYVRPEAFDAVLNQLLPAAMRGERAVDDLVRELNERMNHQMDLGKELV